MVPSDHGRFSFRDRFPSLVSASRASDRQRRPAHVATQVLEPPPVVGGDPRVCVEVEPFDLYAPSSLDLVAAPSPGRLTCSPKPSYTVTIAAP